jgi:dolichol kinase
MKISINIAIIIALFISSFGLILPFYYNKIHDLLLTHVYLIVTIFTGIFATIVISYKLVQKKMIHHTHIRKIYHFLTFIIFSRIISNAYQLIIFGFIGMLLAFSIFELLRKCGVEAQKIAYYNEISLKTEVKQNLSFFWYFIVKNSPLVQISIFFDRFKDEKDSDELILSHFYLLVGNLWPILQNYNIYGTQAMQTHTVPYKRNFIGLVFISVCDSMASICGKLYGKRKVVGNKTIAGFQAYFLSGLIMFAFFIPPTSLKTVEFSTCLMTGLVELLSMQNDNLILPLLALTIYR